MRFKNGDYRKGGCVRSQRLLARGWLESKVSNVVRHTRPRTYMSTITERKTARYGGHRGGNILEFYAEEFRPEALPVELFRQQVIQWFLAAQALRVFEALR